MTGPFRKGRHPGTGRTGPLTLTPALARLYHAPPPAPPPLDSELLHRPDFSETLFSPQRTPITPT